jgi:hypothetical protein
VDYADALIDSKSRTFVSTPTARIFIVIIGISIQPTPFELVHIQACFLVHDSCDPREIGEITLDPRKLVMTQNIDFVVVLPLTATNSSVRASLAGRQESLRPYYRSLHELFVRDFDRRPFYMEIHRLNRRINALEDGLSRMTRSRNWYQKRYFKLMAFHENGIASPFRIKCPPDGGIPVAASVQEHTLPPTKLDETKNTVLYDLILNCDRDPSRHRYSKHTISFAFAAHVFFGACYRFLREILDLSSEQTLRESTSERVALIQSI